MKSDCPLKQAVSSSATLSRSESFCDSPWNLEINRTGSVPSAVLLPTSFRIITFLPSPDTHCSTSPMLVGSRSYFLFFGFRGVPRFPTPTPFCFLPPPACQHPVLCQLSQDQSFGSSASRILYLLIYRKHDSTLESLAYTLDPGCRHHLKMLRVSYVKFKYCTLWQQTAPSSFAQLLTLELFVFLETLSCLTPAVLLYVRPCIS